MSKNILENIFSPPGHIEQADMDAYLRGDASAEQIRKVEAAMLDDELYSEAVEGYEEMGLSAVPALEDFSEFKKKLPELEGAKVVPMRPASQWRRVAIAVAAVMVAVAGYFLLLDSSPPTGQELFSSYYKVYENDISLQRRGDTSFQLEPNLQAALEMYANGDYAASLARFEKALEAEPNNEAAHFFCGMAYLESGNAGEAIDHFNIASIGEGTYARTAHWYAVLTALKLDDKELASDLLDSFLETSGNKTEEAKKLRSEF
jgi:tetratricopeptide (TPR) repeat protein